MAQTSMVVRGAIRKEHEVLALSMYKLSIEEGLLAPTEIKFRSPLNGNKRRLGYHIQKKNNGHYRIIISLREAQFLECEDGRYRDKQGKRYSRVVGKWIPFRTVINTGAHELAHAKYIKHGSDHEAYTEYLEERLCELLQAEGVDINAKVFDDE